ncbi:hypothetical protein QBC37DRAFT_377738 [Rhypophila decipiens]|uniref:Uncharacterized protein n=1 Tax=Rhypophila decipiens TaxID=261697 RepID=A0AAN6XZE3_9PEZI|nr:hypothetical protein QBC37DRAFT_377738 [Rhypophila decipiens]
MHFLATAATGLAAIGSLATLVHASPINSDHYDVAVADPVQNTATSTVGSGQGTKCCATGCFFCVDLDCETCNNQWFGQFIECCTLDQIHAVGGGIEPFRANMPTDSPGIDPDNEAAAVSSSVVIQESLTPTPPSVIGPREQVGYCCMGGCTFCDPHHGCFVERKCYYPDRPHFDHCCLYHNGMIWQSATRDSVQVVMDNKGSFANPKKPVEARTVSPEGPTPVTQTPVAEDSNPPRAGYCCQGGCHFCSEGHRCVIDDGCFYPSKPQYDYCCPYNPSMVWIPGDIEDDEAVVPADPPQSN